MTTRTLIALAALLASATIAAAAGPEGVAQAVAACCDAFADCCEAVMDCCP